eukprot:8956517-Pyramimonas_sp.AAC.1
MQPAPGAALAPWLAALIVPLLLPRPKTPSPGRLRGASQGAAGGQSGARYSCSVGGSGACHASTARTV